MEAAGRETSKKAARTIACMDSPICAEVRWILVEMVSEESLTNARIGAVRLSVNSFLEQVRGFAGVFGAAEAKAGSFL